MKLYLTQNKITQIDESDAHLSKYNWIYAKPGYAMRTFYIEKEKFPVFLHHAIMGKPLNGKLIDHINGDSLDNRKSNLRIVDRRVNRINTERTRNGKLPGANRYTTHKNGKGYTYWRATIRVNGVTKHLGHFNSEQEASNAYYIALATFNAL